MVGKFQCKDTTFCLYTYLMSICKVKNFCEKLQLKARLVFKHSVKLSFVCAGLNFI